MCDSNECICENTLCAFVKCIMDLAVDTKFLFEHCLKVKLIIGEQISELPFNPTYAGKMSIPGYFLLT